MGQHIGQQEFTARDIDEQIELTSALIEHYVGISVRWQAHADEFDRQIAALRDRITKVEEAKAKTLRERDEAPAIVAKHREVLAKLHQRKSEVVAAPVLTKIQKLQNQIDALKRELEGGAK